MTEAAFATILLVGAGLLLRSLWTMLQVDPGFRVESVVTAELSPGRTAAASLEKTVAVSEQVRAKLAQYPGVMNVAAMNVLPLTPEASAFAAAIEDHPRPAQEPQFVLWSTVVTPEHLATLGIRLLQGRRFTAADRKGAQPVVLSVAVKPYAIPAAHGDDGRPAAFEFRRKLAGYSPGAHAGFG